MTDVAWNTTDETLMLVQVNVKDINDNGPKFTRHKFTAGVTRDTQPGEEPVIAFMVRHQNSVTMTPERWEQYTRKPSDRVPEGNRSGGSGC